MDPVRRLAAVLVGAAVAGYIVWLVGFAPDGMFFSRKGVFALLPVLPIVWVALQLLSKPLPSGPAGGNSDNDAENTPVHDADFDV